MSPDSRLVPTSAPQLARGQFRWVLVSLMLASFVLLTTEFMLVGLLPSLTRELHITPARAGTLVSLFALSAAIAGPPLAIAARAIERRRLLSGIVLGYSALNLLTAVWPTFWTLAFGRVLQGGALPVFISAASVTVADLAGAGRGGRAIAFLNYGMAGATVAGIPAGALIAGLTDWPHAFLALGGFGLLVGGALGLVLPRIQAREVSSIAGQIGLLRQPVFLAHLGLSVVMFAGMFAGYTYLGVLLEEILGWQGRALSTALLVFGLLGVVGNWLAARLVDRDPLGLAGANAAMLAIAMVLTVVADARLLVYAAGALWGIAHMASFVFNHVRVLAAGRAAAMFAGALSIAASNVGVALGAAAGGWIATHSGVVWTVVAGAAVAGFAAVIVAVLLSEHRRKCSARGSATLPRFQRGA